MSKVRTNDGYKDIEAVYAGSIPIDTIYDKNGNILFSAYNEVNGISPLSFKSKTNNSSTLKNYRIYGKTSKNLFDYNSWKNVITGVTNSGTITFNSDNSFTLTSGETADVYTLPTTASNAFRCPVKGNTTYTFSFSSNNSTNGLIYLFENGINDSDHKHIAFNQTTKSVTFTTQSDTTYINVRFGVYSANSSITYKEVQLVEGEQIIEYEPYGESVGDKTANLFNGTLNANTGLATNTGLPTSQTGRVSSGPIPISSDSVTITYDSDDVIILYSVLNGDVLVRRVAAVGGQEIHSGDTLDTSAGALLYICFYKYRNGQTVRINPSDISNIMLNSGSEALPYEPYGYKVPVKIEGKNLLQNTATTQTLGADDTHPGITFTVNNDGSIIVNGSSGSTQIFKWEMGSIPAGTQIILSGCPAGGGNNKHKLDIRNASLQALAADSGNGATYTITGVEKYVLIKIAANYVCDNLTFYPMIRRVEIADGTYEPYHVPTATNIYLPEQIKKVGNEAEYIDFKEQKQYRVRKNYIDLNNIIYQGAPTRPYLNNSVLVFPASQTSTQVARMTIPELNKDTTFTVSFDAVVSENTTATFYFDGYPDSVNKNTSLGTDKLITVSNTSTHYSYSGVLGAGTDSIRFYRISTNTNYDTSVISVSNIQLELGSVETIYEPYITNTELDVTLPSISIPSGINTLSAETEVQPSDIYLKGKIEKKPKIYYYSQDGQTLLYTESVLKGSNGIYSGTPTKTADPQYTYTFAGWSNSTGQTTATSGVRDNIQSDKNVYAAFSQTLNTYTVYFYNGETLLQTTPNVTYGGSATYSGTTPTKTGTSTKEYIFTGWSPSPTNISGDTSCYAQYVELTQTITDSWQEILENSTDGTYTSKYAVGDTKIIDLGTEGKVAMEIVGIDTDDLSDNSGKAPITWISKQVLNVFHRMNPRYRAGVEGTGALGGWEKTEMRNYLKETIKPLIPSVVRNNISSVKKYTNCYNVSEQRVSNVLTIEDVWIPSKQEVSPNGDFSYESSGVYYSQAFPNTESRIKKRVKVPGTIFWWLRTAVASGYFSEVYSAGTFSSDDAGNMRGVVLGFCTGKLPIYTITYKSQDGQTTLYTENVIQGKNGTYNTTPTKSSTAQYDYTFAGWSTSANSTTATPDITQDIQSDKVVYAAFAETVRSYTVTFYNGDTPLETIYNIPYGGSATYSGSTPTKTNYTFTGWSPEPTNISGDTSCYAQFEAANTGLITDSWETIATRAAAGTAQNYYSVGDCKAVTLNGTCGTLELNNVTLYVYVLGFDHNSALEGTGITFGGFKTNYDSSGKDVALIDSHCDSNDTTGLKWFNMNHRQGSSQYGHNYGGWKGSDMRYDILGSTDTAPSGYGTTATTSNVGYDASPTCAINPVANTLMSCLPSDLRAVMKPITKYTDNVGNSSNISGNVTTSIDYLPLLAEYEIFEERTYANQYEQNNQAQYAYYADSNNSKVKYRHSSTGSAAYWWGRSPHYGSGYIFCGVHIFGGASSSSAMDSCGVAPIFLVGLQTYTVSYYSQDGLTLLGTETVDNGHNAQGLAQNPTKASDTDCDYTFVGWNSQGNKTTAEANILNSITQNKTVYAAFEQVYKSDTISDSWEDIIESCSDGTYSSKYSIGDLKTIDLGTEGVVQMQIVGIDTDDKADDNGKAPITWISKQLLNTRHRMNPAYSSGTEGTGTLGGWEKAEMRSYLKETVKSLIPETVRNAIKPVKKYTRGSSVSNVLTTDDVWIPSKQEVSGNYSSESSGVYYSSAFPDNTSRIKSKVDGGAAWWWLRSADDINHYIGVSKNGSYNYSVADSTGSVALGFCT